MPEIWMQFPGGLSRCLTLSYDDGVEQDEELLAIMAAHGLKGTFNLNSGLMPEEEPSYPKGQIHRRLSRAGCLRVFADSGQEVALHAATHPHLEQLPRHLMAQEVLSDRLTLEAMYGRIVRGMAYPFGTYSDELVEVLKALDVAYARTVESTGRFDIPRDWLRLPATCHHNDPALFALLDRFLGPAERPAPRLFYLWGHSYEFERDNNWQLIRDFAARAGQREDIWYATNIEVYDYVQAYRRLVFSADGRRLYNPSAGTLWLSIGDAALSIAGGEHLSLQERITR